MRTNSRISCCTATTSGTASPKARLYRSRLRNGQEVEANNLAADILMPYDKIEEVIDDDRWRDASLDEVAAKFGVSKSALKVRLGIA